MLMERIVGAFTFKKEVYADVESDTSFTKTAWVIVTVVAFLNQIGQLSNYETISSGLVATFGNIIFTVGGFALGAFVVSALGKAMFNAETDFNEMVRVLGLAFVWKAIGVVGILGLISPALICLLSPAIFAAWAMGVASWFIATKESLDLEMMETIVTVLVGMFAILIVNLIGGLILGILGFGTMVFGA